MKRILLYTVCGLAMLTMFNSCHIYNKYHRPDVDVEGYRFVAYDVCQWSRR